MNKQTALTTFLPFLMATLLRAQQTTPLQEPAIPVTTITFDETEFDFGRLAQGEKVQHIFRFTNTGTDPLLLFDARGSCGCTVPSWPKDMIEPGETGAIVVEFDSKGKLGQQAKRVTVTTNSELRQSILFLKGEIYLPSEDENPYGNTIQSVLLKPIQPTETIDIVAFPNPTATTLWLKIPDAVGQSAGIEIFDKNGQLIDKIIVPGLEAEALRMDVSKYESGSYWLSVKVGDTKRVSVPFIVVR